MPSTATDFQCNQFQMWSDFPPLALCLDKWCSTFWLHGPNEKPHTTPPSAQDQAIQTAGIPRGPEVWQQGSDH